MIGASAVMARASPGRGRGDRAEGPGTRRCAGGGSTLVGPGSRPDDGAGTDASTLTFRPVAPGDADGLVALYGTLSDQDRYRRFFTACAPPHEFFEHMASVVGRGGYGVVAVDAGGRIVGEANYELLADGDG